MEVIPAIDSTATFGERYDAVLDSFFDGELDNNAAVALLESMQDDSETDPHELGKATDLLETVIAVDGWRRACDKGPLFNEGVVDKAAVNSLLDYLHDVAENRMLIKGFVGYQQSHNQGLYIAKSFLEKL